MKLTNILFLVALSACLSGPAWAQDSAESPPSAPIEAPESEPAEGQLESDSAPVGSASTEPPTLASEPSEPSEPVTEPESASELESAVEAEVATEPEVTPEPILEPTSDMVVEAPELNVHASIRPRLEARFGHQFGLLPEDLRYGFASSDTQDLFSQQSQVGVSLAGDRLSARTTFQFAQVWGDPTNTQLNPSPIQLYEAWIDFKFLESLALRAGRFEIAYGEQRLLGSVGWSQVGRTWDGLRLRATLPLAKSYVDVFSARNTDGGPGSKFLANDGFLSGVYAHFESLPILSELDLYVLGDTQLSEPGGIADHRKLLLTSGARVNVVKAGLDVVAEGALQMGSRCAQGIQSACLDESIDAQAWFAEAQFGYRLGGFRGFLGGSIASGDDPETATNEAFDQLYPTGHAHLGWMDFFARTNLIDVHVGASYKFGDKTLILKIHEFHRLQPEMQRLGNEIDGQIIIPLVSGLVADAGFGLFLPDEGMAATGDPSGLANWLFLQMSWVY